jgi:hypothetical protein
MARDRSAGSAEGAKTSGSSASFCRGARSFWHSHSSSSNTCQESDLMLSFPPDAHCDICLAAVPQLCLVSTSRQAQGCPRTTGLEQFSNLLLFGIVHVRLGHGLHQDASFFFLLECLTANNNVANFMIKEVATLLLAVAAGRAGPTQTRDLAALSCREMPMSVEWRPFFHASFMRKKMAFENQQDLKFHDQGGIHALPGGCGKLGARDAKMAPARHAHKCQCWWNHGSHSPCRH